MSLLLDLIYLLAFVLVSPWIFYRLLASGNWRVLPQRLGFGLGRPLTGSILLHGSSVGEVSLLKPLIAVLESDMPGVPLVVSSNTATGVAAARAAFPEHRVIVFPIDFSFVVKRLLRRFQPRLLVIVESEFWPNLLLAAARLDVPAVLLNGKMSAKSRNRYARSRIVPRVLREFRVVAVQSEEHAARMRSLGVAEERLSVTGNMKYDSSPAIADPAAVRARLRAELAYGEDEVVIVGGSLHEPEDQVLFEAFTALDDGSVKAALILVPRYPARAAEIARRLAARGRPSVMKSRIDSGVQPAPGSEAVLIVDTVGQLRTLYGVADIAYVGGSLHYRGSNKGGHNLMEPAAFGVATIFGPHNFSFKETVEDLRAADAGIMVRDDAELRAALGRLVHDGRRRQAMGDRARQVIAQGRGATDRNYRLICGLLTAGARSLQGHARDLTMPRSRSDPETL